MEERLPSTYEAWAHSLLLRGGEEYTLCDSNFQICIATQEEIYSLDTYGMRTLRQVPQTLFFLPYTVYSDSLPFMSLLIKLLLKLPKPISQSTNTSHPTY